MNSKPVVEGCVVNVGFPDGEQVRGVVVAQWDSTWYHIKFSVDADCQFRDQIVERTRFLHIEDPVAADCHELKQAGPSKSRYKSSTKTQGKNGPAKLSSLAVAEPSLANPFVDASKQITAGVDGELMPFKNKESEIEVMKRDLESRFIEKSALAKRKAELDRLHAALLEEKRMLQTSFKVSFPINPEYSGYMIGRNGSTLARAQEIPNVRRVDLKDGEVTIFADTFEAAECARDMLEIECLEVPISRRERSLIIGRGGKNVRDLQAKAGLIKLQIDGKGNVQLLGCRKAVTVGKKILDLITRFLVEQQALEEVNQLPSEDDHSSNNCVKYDDSYIFSEEGSSYSIQVAEEKIGLVIGVRGATIREIREKTGCKIEMVKDAVRPGCTWNITSSSVEAADKAAAWIQELVSEPPVGSVHDGVVVRVSEAGALVSFGRREGFVHVAQLSQALGRRVEAVSDAVKPGDALRVRVTGIDDRGRLGLALGTPLNAAAQRAVVAPVLIQSPQMATASGQIAAAAGGQGAAAEGPSVAADGWPSLGGTEEGGSGLGQYAAWSRRVKEQRERARTEAEMRRGGPPTCRDSRDDVPHQAAAALHAERHAAPGQRGPGKPVPSKHPPESAPALPRPAAIVDRRVAAEGQAEAKDSPRGTTRGPGPKPVPGRGPGNAGGVAGASTDGRGGPADRGSSGAGGAAAGAAGAAGAGSEAQSAPLDGARHAADRPAVRPGFGPGVAADAGGTTRRALAGDADYCRDYVRYAPAAAGPGGTRRVQRTCDRDGGEEGGGQVVPSAAGRGRGRGRDR